MPCMVLELVNKMVEKRRDLLVHQTINSAYFEKCDIISL